MGGVGGCCGICRAAVLPGRRSVLFDRRRPTHSIRLFRRGRLGRRAVLALDPGSRIARGGEGADRSGNQRDGDGACEGFAQHFDLL